MLSERSWIIQQFHTPVTTGWWKETNKINRAPPGHQPEAWCYVPAIWARCVSRCPFHKAGRFYLVLDAYKARASENLSGAFPYPSLAPVYLYPDKFSTLFLKMPISGGYITYPCNLLQFFLASCLSCCLLSLLFPVLCIMAYCTPSIYFILNFMHVSWVSFRVKIIILWTSEVFALSISDIQLLTQC